jgi:hypothetical protein
VAALRRKVAALPPEKWLPLADALARVKAVLGPSNDLAVRDLTQHLRAGRLTAGARRVTAVFADTDACFVFTRAYFQQDAVVNRPLPEPRVRATAGGWYVFIRRAEFDRLYPGAVTAAAAVAADDGLPPLPRGKPGRKPRDNWPTLVGAWLIAVAVKDPDKLRNIDALVVDAENFLQQKIGWAPRDTKDLRSKIRHFLQFVRS